MRFLRKEILYLAITALFIFPAAEKVKSQEISPYLIGNNAWLPSWMGGSKINELWNELEYAGFQMIRIGGNGAQNASAYTKERIGVLVKQIRDAGAETVIQVPYSFNAAQTKSLIEYINGTLSLNVKYWSIGNEPNLNNSSHTPIPVSQVATYIRTIATALKAYDPSVKIMAPGTAWYDTAYINPLLVNKGNDDVSGKDANGNYYIDILNWHKYDVAAGSDLEGNVNSTINVINNINATRPEANKMSWAITEFNSHYDNGLASADKKVWSFNSGQMFAEVYNLGMKKGAFTICAWSIFESGGIRSNGDLGLFDFVNGQLKGRSIYYHSLMLGKNMKKNSITTTDNQTNVAVIPMSDETGSSVMILNKNKTTGYNYSLRLDNGAFTLPNVLQIKVNAGLNIETSGSIAKHATQMLVFDAAGILVKRYTYTSLDADGFGEPMVENISADPTPIVTLTAPEDNTNVGLKSSVVLTAEATDNGNIQKVEFTANGALIGKTTTAPYTFAWTPSISGTYVVSARAFDNLGGVGFAAGSATVTVEKVYTYLPIPGTIQAEAFDEMSGIQLEPTTDTGGGQNIGYCDTGDWLDYTINVPATGNYLVEARVASLNKTGAFDLKSGTKVFASFALPAGTGGWQSWTTISKTVNLSEGNQILRLAITGNEININWLKFSSISTSASFLNSGKIQIYPNPSSGGKFTLMLNVFTENEPVKIEMYDLSGKNIYSGSHNLISGSAEISLNDKMVEPGLYIISVQSKTANLREKVVITE